MTNAAAIGYMIMAARKCGQDEGIIHDLEDAMNETMDFHDEAEAEKTYSLF